MCAAVSPSGSRSSNCAGRGAAHPPRPFPRRLGAARVPQSPLRSAAQGADVGRLRDMFLRASRRRRSSLLIENVHWIDASSGEFLAHLAAGLPGHRVLLVLTAAAGLRRRWPAPPARRDDRPRRPRRRRSRGMVRRLLGARTSSRSRSSSSSPTRARGIRSTSRKSSASSRRRAGSSSRTARPGSGPPM